MQAPVGLPRSLGTAAPAYLGLRVHAASAELHGAGTPVGRFSDHSRKTLSPRRENTASRRPQLGPVGVDLRPREGLWSPGIREGRAELAGRRKPRSALVEPDGLAGVQKVMIYQQPFSNKRTDPIG